MKSLYRNGTLGCLLQGTTPLLRLLTLDSRDTCGAINILQSKYFKISERKILFQNFKSSKSTVKKGKGKRKSLFILHRYLRAETCALGSTDITRIFYMTYFCG